MKTSKEIKLISAELRQAHESNPTAETRDKFNEWQFKKWIDVDELRQVLADMYDNLPDGDDELLDVYENMENEVIKKCLKK